MGEGAEGPLSRVHMSLGTQRVPQPNAGARSRVAVDHLNLIVKVKILQSKKQKISKKIVKVIIDDPFTLQREWSNI